jgi:hypothetical protein
VTLFRHPLYMMVEIPSSVILLPDFAEYFEGFSIGSNDRTQLTLGVDRDSEIVAHVFDERDEAVRRLIAQAIQTARSLGRKIGLCGQAPSDYPEFARFLVECGIDSMSLNPDAVLRTTRQVLDLEAARAGGRLDATASAGIEVASTSWWNVCTRPPRPSLMVISRNATHGELTVEGILEEVTMANIGLWLPLACTLSVTTITGLASERAVADGNVLTTVRIPTAVLANGAPLPAGTYDIRLTQDQPVPHAGQSRDAQRWVEFVADGKVIAREVAEVLQDHYLPAIGASSLPVRSGTRVDILKGGEFLRISVKRDRERFLIYMPVMP